MSDSRLRLAEREYYSNLDNDSFCKYVAELKRSYGRIDTDKQRGRVTGELPAIIHLLANNRMRGWPAEMKPDYTAMAEGVPYREIHKVIDQDVEKAKLCLPPSGIIPYVLSVFAAPLRRLGEQALYCSCGGEDRGHAPNCVYEMGSGHIVEDYYEQIQAWVSPHSDFNLLDEYLRYGNEGLVDSFDGDNSIYDIFEHLNAALGTDFHAAMVRDVPKFDYFKLSLADHSTDSVVTIVIENNTCVLGWSVPEIVVPENYGSGYLSNQFSAAIKDIPSILHDYPVWR